MLEPDQWDSVLGSVTGTIYRGTERISSNALLNVLEVGPDPVARQKVAKRIFDPRSPPRFSRVVRQHVFEPSCVARGSLFLP
jgi:hypothetical protein